MNNKKYFVYLGSSGFPYGLAEIKKMTLISKSLVLKDHSVTIINKKGVHSSKNYPDLKVSGNSEGINYVYTSGDPFFNKNFSKRNLLKIKGILNEFQLLYKLRKDKQLDYAILSTHSFTSIFYYAVLSKLFGFKTILNHVEYYSGVKMNRSNVGKWINDKLYDQYAPLLVDISFPISEFLIDHLKKITPNKKYFKIPVLAEFEKYNGVETLEEPKYFFFSGAAAYTEIIMFIIDSFNRLKNSSAYLYLGVKGSEADLTQIRKYISNNFQKEKIKLFTTLTEKQLYNYYQNATALLIPLRPTIQDKARFPHKIGEYLASGNPVISTNYGEVKYYFIDGETMLIADSYNIESFSNKMQFVIDNPVEAQKIGKNGQTLASSDFDYKNYGAKIIDFLNGEI